MGMLAVGQLAAMGPPHVGTHELTAAGSLPMGPPLSASHGYSFSSSKGFSIALRAISSKTIVPLRTRE